MKKITVEEYNKKMNKIMEKKLPVNETLVAMLQEASKYTLKDIKKLEDISK